MPTSPTLRGLTTPLPYHLLLYSALLGTSLYQTFLNTKIAYRTIPMPHFAAYQSAIFPAYFAVQSTLFPLVALTYPGGGLRGLLGRKGGLGLWVPLAAGCACAWVNAARFGPRTQAALFARAAGLAGKSSDAGEEVRRLRAGFSRNHAMAIHLNLVAVVATVWYGLALGGRLAV